LVGELIKIVTASPIFVTRGDKKPYSISTEKPVFLYQYRHLNTRKNDTDSSIRDPRITAF
jgi:hypothetical protein